LLGLDGSKTRPYILIVERYDPDVRGLLVGGEIDIYGAEDDPLSIGRWHWFADALQLHHVFEGERVFGLSGQW